MVKQIRKNSVAFLGLALLSLVMLTAAVIAGQSPVYDPVDTVNHRTIMEPRDLEANTSSALNVAFETEQYDLSLNNEQTVPPLVLTSLPVDLASIQSPKKRQKLFLRALLPIILIENRRISEQRELAKLLLEGNPPAEGSPMNAWLKKLAKRLRVRGQLDNPQVKARILSRLDVIPVDLALAQAAIETGWGTSRFALEGNSLFGQWTFISTGGLIPTDRDSDASHFVASFPDLRTSVRAYLRNLNTGRAYKEFRAARAKLREEGKQLDAMELANYLHRYSERGNQYTTELQRLIKNHHIATLAKAGLGSLKSQFIVASLD
ncbi:glucosaminidase domain-containing protein [Kaarinaea lacus]